MNVVDSDFRASGCVCNHCARSRPARIVQRRPTFTTACTCDRVRLAVPVRSCVLFGVGDSVVSAQRQLATVGEQAKGALGVAQSATTGRNRNPASGGTLSKPEGPVFPKGAVNTRCRSSSELPGPAARQERESSEAQAESQTRM